MSFTLKPTKLFLEQLENLSPETKKLLRKRLELVKESPGRNKRIQGYNLFLFRLRFSENSREKRVIYMIENDAVVLLCILDRDNNYKDLRKYLKKLGY